MDKYHLACDTITFTKSLHIVMFPVLPFASLPSPSPAVTPLPKGEALAGRKVSAKRYAFINTMKKTTVVKNFRMLETARKLRREMTPQETKLWFEFLRSYPVKFYKQRVIEYYIADFYCARAKLVIELDGSQHYTEQGKCYDAERTAVLEGHGLMVLRFSNHEVSSNFEGVCAVIENAVRERCPDSEP